MQSMPTGLHAVLETLSALYTMDGRGRLVGAHDGGVLPRFVLGRSAEGCVWRFRADLPAALVVALARLAGRERGADFASAADGELPAPPERLGVMVRMLAAAAEARPTGSPAEIGARRRPVERDGVTLGELWSID